MPKFLEDRLRSQAASKGLSAKQSDRYVYGAMNNLGAMHGSKVTAKGTAMERTHEDDSGVVKLKGHPNRHKNLGKYLHPRKAR